MNCLWIYVCLYIYTNIYISCFHVALKLIRLTTALGFQVGACIVNEDKIIVGMGYNSMPYLNSHVTDEKQTQNDDCFPWERGDGYEKEKHNTATKYPYGNHFLCMGVCVCF